MHDVSDSLVKPSALGQLLVSGLKALQDHETRAYTVA